MLHCMNHLASINVGDDGWLLTNEELSQVRFDNPLAAIGVDSNTVQRLREQSPLVRFDERSRRFETVQEQDL